MSGPGIAIAGIWLGYGIGAFAHVEGWAGVSFGATMATIAVALFGAMAGSL